MLRINRPFMEKMRASKYAEEALQQFNMAVVEVEAAHTPAGGEAGPSNMPVEMLTPCVYGCLCLCLFVQTGYRYREAAAARVAGAATVAV